MLRALAVVVSLGAMGCRNYARFEYDASKPMDLGGTDIIVPSNDATVDSGCAASSCDMGENAVLFDDAISLTIPGGCTQVVGGTFDATPGLVVLTENTMSSSLTLYGLPPTGNGQLIGTGMYVAIYAADAWASAGSATLAVPAPEQNPTVTVVDVYQGSDGLTNHLQFADNISALAIGAVYPPDTADVAAVGTETSINFEAAGAGNGSLAKSVSGSLIALYDYNGDGRLDLVTYDSVSEVLQWFENGGNKLFDDPVTIQGTFAPVAMSAVGDTLAILETNTIQLIVSESSHVLYTPGQPLEQMATGDLDSEGTIGLFAFSGTTMFYWSGKELSGTPNSVSLAMLPTSQPIVFDANNDTRKDIVYCSSNNLVYLPQEKTP